MLDEEFVFHWDDTVDVSLFILDDTFENIGVDCPVSLIIKSLEIF
jgi:hypothetical protein